MSVGGIQVAAVNPVFSEVVVDAAHGLLLAVPLRKIQLRYIRRDGFPHSPFREYDCVAADMFMLRRHRRRFEDYLKRTFTTVRANPGKHSG